MMHNKKSDAFRLLDYVTDHGADHDEDCPGDDTCNCSFSGRNAAVNRLVKALLDEPAAPPVPLATPTHVEIDHDGDLSIDFDRANDRVVSLTIYQDGRVGYSALVDGKTAHGIVNATEPMPAWVRAAICAPPVPETPQGERCIDYDEIAKAVHYYTGEDVDVLVARYRSESSPAPAVPPQEGR